MKIQAIALNTFKEAVRNKIFYLLVVFGILSALSSRIISLLTLGDRAKVLMDIGLASIDFFSVLIAVFTGINLVYKEIDKRTIYNILSKPISRSTFIIGKFCGLALTLLIALSSMAAIFLLFLYISVGTINIELLFYFIFLYMQLLIITAISLLFSSFSTPILSSIFTISLYLIGQVIWTFNMFTHLLRNTFQKIIAYGVYYILPNLDKFNIKNAVVMGTGVSGSQVWDALIYAAVYISAILILSILIFDKKEFQ